MYCDKKRAYVKVPRGLMKAILLYSAIFVIKSPTFSVRSFILSDVRRPETFFAPTSVKERTFENIVKEYFPYKGDIFLSLNNCSLQLRILLHYDFRNPFLEVIERKIITKLQN